ncbi:MAG: hypothetical protein HYX54_09335 [Chloroflexi bacterium]|nr:hypothetical protein [Chloroflexota bacterium]
MITTLKTRLGRSVVLTTALFSISAGSTLAHGPDPLQDGKLWAQDQAVTYQWRSLQAPPKWMADAIDRAAADAGISRASRAATFARVASGSSSLIAYGEPTGCTSAGIACFNRVGAPVSFKMWFRAHGYVFDWGTLRWCEGLSTIADGCFDAETAALDEFGHVEVLAHHANYSTGSDYLDAVVQTVSRARPKTGWLVHAFARCDTARLQLEYDRRTFRDTFSSCLAIPTTTTIGASPSSIYVGSSVRFTATLKTTASTANRALANDPISGRTVKLQRRTVGSSTWTSVGTMAPNGTVEGSYVLTLSPTATYEWSATFVPASGDGAVMSMSPAVKVTVTGCSGFGCPSNAVQLPGAP